jgi:hypothetical protein
MEAAQQQQQQQQTNGCASDSRPSSSGSDSTSSTDSVRSNYGSSEVSSKEGVKCGSPAAAVMLPPGAFYTVRVTLATSSRRKHSQAELGVISQMCVVTAVAADPDSATETAEAASTSVSGLALDDIASQQQQASSSKQQKLSNGSTRQQQQSRAGTGGDAGSSKGLGGGMPAGWQLLVAGVPVAGGLVGQLADLQVTLDNLIAYTLLAGLRLA